VPTRVFSQQPDLVAALPQLLQHARRFFSMDVEVLSASAPDRSEPEHAFVVLRLDGHRYPCRGEFRVESRAAKDDDRRAAQRAEARGRAGGMALLAARCGSVWTIFASSTNAGTAELQLSALLASVALGPVLPPDESTLYGVRGAMERAEKASARDA